MRTNPLFLLMLLLFSCNQEMTENVAAFHRSNSSSSLVSNIDHIHWIPLESNEIMLGETTWLIPAADSFIVVDVDNARILRYAPDGHYLNCIGEKGKGPGEYLNIDSVQPLGDTLVVFSMPNATIHQYLLDGSYLGNETVMQEGFQYACVREGILSYCGYGAAGPYRLVLTEEDGRVHHFLKHSSEIISFMDNVPVFSFNNDTALLREPFGRTIYKYHNKELTPEITFDLGEYGLKDEFFDLDFEQSGEYLMTRDYGMISNYLQSDSWRFVEIFFPQEQRYDYGLSNGDGWSWFTFSGRDMNPFVHSFKQLQNGVLYCLINPFYFNNIDAAILEKADNPEQIANIREDDNYVVAMLYLK